MKVYWRSSKPKRKSQVFESRDYLGSLSKTQRLWIWSTNYKSICSNASITHSASTVLSKVRSSSQSEKVTVQNFACKPIRQKFSSCISPLMRTSRRCRISTRRSGICRNSSAITHICQHAAHFLKHSWNIVGTVWLAAVRELLR